VPIQLETQNFKNYVKTNNPLILIGGNSIEQASSESSTHSGSFTLSPNQPERKGNSTHWGASCASGGWAYAKVEDDSKTVYCRGGSKSPGGCDVGIGVEAALEKACRGE
jgi:hypothetical protein